MKQHTRRPPRGGLWARLVDRNEQKHHLSAPKFSVLSRPAQRTLAPLGAVQALSTYTGSIARLTVADFVLTHCAANDFVRQAPVISCA